MNQLTTIGNDNSLIELENTQKMCERLMKSPHYAKMGPDGIFAIISKSKSLGIDPFDGLNGSLYYVKGKVGMPAETMCAMIRAKGHSIQRDPKSNDSICILHGRRADNGDTWTTSFSVEDAKRAGLIQNGGSYDKYLPAMLYNRALSFLARQLFADIVKGAGYGLDELKEIAGNQSKIEQLPQQSVEYVVEAPVIKETITEEKAKELEALLAECDPKYYEAVLTGLKKLPQPFNSIREITMDLYEKIKLAAIKKKSEYQQRMREDLFEDAQIKEG